MSKNFRNLFVVTIVFIILLFVFQVIALSLLKEDIEMEYNSFVTKLEELNNDRK